MNVIYCTALLNNCFKHLTKFKRFRKIIVILIFLMYGIRLVVNAIVDNNRELQVKDRYVEYLL